MSQSANEIINIQIGQCGNHIGHVWLEQILKEHKLDENGTKQGEFTDRYDHLLWEKINSYFYEKGRGILANAYIRQSIESKYSSLYHIPTDV